MSAIAAVQQLLKNSCPVFRQTGTCAGSVGGRQLFSALWAEKQRSAGSLELTWVPAEMGWGWHGLAADSLGSVMLGSNTLSSL